MAPGNAGVAKWQTRTLEGRVGNTVWVQVPSPAPIKSDMWRSTQVAEEDGLLNR